MLDSANLYCLLFIQCRNCTARATHEAPTEPKPAKRHETLAELFLEENRDGGIHRKAKRGKSAINIQCGNVGRPSIKVCPGAAGHTLASMQNRRPVDM